MPVPGLSGQADLDVGDECAADRGQRAGDDAVVRPSPALGAGDQARVGQLLVMGDGRLAQADGAGEVADAGLAAGVAAISETSRTRCGSGLNFPWS